MRYHISVLVLLFATIARATTFYVSPAGVGTTCSQASPGGLSTAAAGLCRGSAPGDTYYLRSNAGNYKVVASRTYLWNFAIKGRVGARVRFMTCPADQNYYGEPSTMATLDCDGGVQPPRGIGCVNLSGSYIDFENIRLIHATTTTVREVANADGNVPPNTWVNGWNQPGAQSSGSGISNRIINCVAHDLASILGAKGKQAYPSLIYGGVFYNYGWGNTTVHMTYGQGIYSQNGDPDVGYPSPATATIEDTIIFGALPDNPLSSNSYAVQIYGSCDAMKRNYLIDGNFAVGRLIVGGCVGGGTAGPPYVKGVYDQVWTNNVIAGFAQMGYNASGCSNLDVTNNHLFGTRIANPPGIYFQEASLATTRPCRTGTRLQNNVLVGNPTAGLFSSAEFPKNTYFTSAYPTVPYSFVRPNQFRTGRCNVYVVNYHDDSAVSVDLSTCGIQDGASYEIRSGWNVDGGPVGKGTYSSASPSVSFAMTTLAVPVSDSYGTKISGAQYEDYSPILRGANLFYMAFVVLTTNPPPPTRTPTPIVTGTGATRQYRAR